MPDISIHPNHEMKKKENVQDKKKNRLGRGISSLISTESPDDDQFSLKTFHNNNNESEEEFINADKRRSSFQEVSVPENKRIWTVSIHKLIPNSSQPRKEFDEKKLEDLANSIRAKGILQPIMVRKQGEELFEILAGERRWRAAQKAGQHDVPIIIRETDDKEKLEIGLIENIQRENLNPIEEAEAYQVLIDKYKLTQLEISEQVGKERSTIANSLRLLGLTDKVKQLVVKNLISMGHAKVLLSLQNPIDQEKAAEKIVNLRLSVRGTESYVSKLLKNLNNKSKDIEDCLGFDVSKKLVENLSHDLQKKLGTKIKIDYNKGKGKIFINFYSDEELNTIVEKISKGCINP